MRRCHSAFLLLLILSCSAKVDKPDIPLVKGADIGWLSEMEAAGVTFYDRSGKKGDCIDILKGLGVNTIRFRVWVNPRDGWCGKDDVVKQAKRAAAMGMRIMINFHYSDFWADPGKQNKPAAWVGKDLSGLNEAIRLHTVDVLNALKANNVQPEWVQVGNETNDGMLWEEGRASKNMPAFAAMINAGHDAIKSVFPSAKVIVHISNGYDNGLFRWMFDGLTANNARYDIIGMSLYPDPASWKDFSNRTILNMKDMISRYGKEVMMCEVGMPWDKAAACKAFMIDLMDGMRSIPNGKALGILYWEPQCHNNWKGYTLGAFGPDGRPTVALEAFSQ